MRTELTDIPALIVSETSGRGRVEFMPAELDRRYGRDNLSDHGNLLANLVRWAANDSIPLEVEGAGFVDCHLYRQPNRFVLHVVNLTSAGTWRAPVEELIRVGPLRVRVRVPDTLRTSRAHLLVAKRSQDVEMKRGWAAFEIPAILDHEVVVIGPTS